MEELRLRVRGYKSLRSLDLLLSDVTILVGVPSAGRSNIGEAIALGGFVDAEVRGEPVPPLERLTRVSRCEDALAPGFEGFTVTLEGGSLGGPLEYAFRCEDGGFAWSRVHRGSGLHGVLTRRVERGEVNLWARLYGFERYSALESILAVERGGCSFRGFLLEDASNIAVLTARRFAYVLGELNARLAEVLGEGGVELRPSRGDGLELYDGIYALPASAASGEVLRLLYYLLALHSAPPRREDGESIVILEEPESYPALDALLVDAVGVALGKGVRVVVLTSSPELAERLARSYTSKLYYVYREGGETRVAELTLRALEEHKLRLADVMSMSRGELRSRGLI